MILIRQVVLSAFLFEILLLILGIVSYIKGKTTDKFTSFTYGKILSIKERKHNAYISTYSISVRYEVEKKEFINRHMKVVGNSCNYKINQLLSIRYDEMNPEKSKISEDNGSVTKKKLLIIIIIMCITAVFIPLS